MDKKASTLYLLSFMMPMTTLLISVALPSMAKEYAHIEHIDFFLKMVMVSPALMIFLLSPFVSEIAERFGYKRVLLASLFIYAFSGMVGFFITSLEWLTLSRLSLGVGAAIAGAMPMILALSYFKGDALSSFLGHRSSFLSLGSTGATIMGGLLVEFGWRYAFLGYGIGIVALTMAFYYLPDLQVQKQKESVSSMGVLKKAFTPYLLVVWMMMVFYLLPVHLPFIMIDEMGLTPLVVGVTLGFVAVVSAYVSHRYLDVKKLISQKMQFIIFFALIGLAYIILYGATKSLADTHIALFMIISSIFLIGLGVGIFRPLSYELVLDSLETHEHKKGLSLYVTVLSLTLFITPLFMEPFIQLVGDTYLFLLIGVVFVLSALYIGAKK
jgi:MFS family permease